jgi:hypothetical protein
VNVTLHIETYPTPVDVPGPVFVDVTSPRGGTLTLRATRLDVGRWRCVFQNSARPD